MDRVRGPCLYLAIALLVAGCSGDGESSAGDGDGDEGDASAADAALPDAEPPGNDFDRTGCVEGDFTGYRGDLHNHTAYSADFDGPSSGTPAAAFALARQNGLDFIAVTDHLNYLTTSEYSQCRAAAEAANQPGSFAAICGYEAQFHGHGMFLFAWSLTSFPTTRGAYFDRIEACGECVGQFNHPANTRFPWLDFSYVAAAEASMELLELNGAPDWDKRLIALAEALDLGWHVSPSWNADTHLANWGSGENRTLVYPAASLSREHVPPAQENRVLETGLAAIEPVCLLKIDCPLRPSAETDAALRGHAHTGPPRKRRRRGARASAANPAAGLLRYRRGGCRRR